MTHAEYIDPNLARRKCTTDELEIILARNYQMSWTTIGLMTGRSRGVVRRIWASANLKVNGGYVPTTRRLSKDERDEERARLAADPDTIRGLRGIPTVGLSRPGAGIVRGKPTSEASGK